MQGNTGRVRMEGKERRLGEAGRPRSAKQGRSLRHVKARQDA
jgi:hypothetical protein